MLDKFFFYHQVLINKNLTTLILIYDFFSEVTFQLSAEKFLHLTNQFEHSEDKLLYYFLSNLFKT